MSNEESENYKGKKQLNCVANCNNKKISKYI